MMEYKINGQFTPRFDSGRLNPRKGRIRKFFRLAPALGAALVLMHLCALPAPCGVKTKIDDEKWFEVGARMQGWYQSVGEENSPHLNDFMVRRFYLYVQGQVHPDVTFFTHLAADRIGQDGTDSPGSGLGTGFSVRDAWITYSPLEELKIQGGRMYVPFTRAYGTESTFAMLPLELPIAQGGVRAKIFYPSNIGRDDGVTVWGNIAKGLVQYRVGVFDGQQGSQNAQKSPRTSGRISISPLEPETAWFNKGNYLGTKKVLSFGLGFDRQADLKWSADRPEADYSAWTADAFFDHPVGSGAVTVETAFVDMENSQEHGDARTFYVQGGVLLPPVTKAFRIQPYARYEGVYRDAAMDTGYAAGGVNLLFKGHDLKLTMEFTKFMPESGSTEKSKSIFTVQMQVGI